MNRAETLRKIPEYIQDEVAALSHYRFWHPNEERYDSFFALMQERFSAIDKEKFNTIYSVVKHSITAAIDLEPNEFQSFVEVSRQSLDTPSRQQVEYLIALLVRKNKRNRAITLQSKIENAYKKKLSAEPLRHSHENVADKTIFLQNIEEIAHYFSQEFFEGNGDYLLHTTSTDGLLGIFQHGGVYSAVDMRRKEMRIANGNGYGGDLPISFNFNTGDFVTSDDGHIMALITTPEKVLKSNPGTKLSPRRLCVEHELQLLPYDFDVGKDLSPIGESYRYQYIRRLHENPDITLPILSLSETILLCGEKDFHSWIAQALQRAAILPDKVILYKDRGGHSPHFSSYLQRTSTSKLFDAVLDEFRQRIDLPKGRWDYFRDIAIGETPEYTRKRSWLYRNLNNQIPRCLTLDDNQQVVLSQQSSE